MGVCVFVCVFVCLLVCVFDCACVWLVGRLVAWLVGWEGTVVWFVGKGRLFGLFGRERILVSWLVSMFACVFA